MGLEQYKFNPQLIKPSHDHLLLIACSMADFFTTCFSHSEPLHNEECPLKSRSFNFSCTFVNIDRSCLMHLDISYRRIIHNSASVQNGFSISYITLFMSSLTISLTKRAYMIDSSLNNKLITTPTTININTLF